MKRTLAAVEEVAAPAPTEEERVTEVTLWDHERYADPADDPAARKVRLSPADLMDFFGR